MKVHGQSFPEHIKGAGNISIGSGKKGKAKRNRDELITAMKREKEKIENSPHLSDAEKKKLKKKLQKRINKLNRPKGNVAVDYNKAVDTLQSVQRKRLQAMNEGKKGCDTSSSNDVSSPNSSSSSSKKSGKSDDKPSKAYQNFEVEEFANEMMENPQKAMDMLDDMSFEEKQMALQEAQMYMQQIQRMMKLQSNLTTMAHKTQSSIIQNIR